MKHPPDLQFMQNLGPFGNRVKALMAYKGISQKSIARKYGLHPSDISRVLCGTRKTPRIQHLIALELGMTVSELFHEHSTLKPTDASIEKK